MNTFSRYAIAFARIGLGWIFFWAFLDKTFGLGFATQKSAAWISGGSPTMGFLKFATRGPFTELYQALAGNVFVDWLFMIGLFCLGLALILGIGLKIASVAGILLMIMMYTAVLPPENNPILDDHIIYAFLLALFPGCEAGSTMGFGKIWARSKLVQKFQFLR